VCLLTATAHFPFTSLDLPVDLFDQGYFLADASHYPKVVYPLGFIFWFSAHPPSLQEIPKNAYPQVRNVGYRASYAF